MSLDYAKILDALRVQQQKQCDQHDAAARRVEFLTGELDRATKVEREALDELEATTQQVSMIEEIIAAPGGAG